jgi:hypothetical protein
LRGIEDRVAPRLTFGVRAARRCAHPVVAQERRGVRPRIAIRIANLEIAVECEATERRSNALVLLVDEELTERIPLDRLGVVHGELLRVRVIVAKPQIAFVVGPVAKAAPVATLADRRVQRVARQPRHVLPAKRGEARA